MSWTCTVWRSSMARAEIRPRVAYCTSPGAPGACPECATVRSATRPGWGWSPSSAHSWMPTRSVSHSRAAASAMVVSTVGRSIGEFAITRRTSDVAACCCRAAACQRCCSATCCFRPAISCRAAASSASRRAAGAASVRRCRLAVAAAARRAPVPLASAPVAHHTPSPASTLDRPPPRGGACATGLACGTREAPPAHRRTGRTGRTGRSVRPWRAPAAYHRPGATGRDRAPGVGRSPRGLPQGRPGVWLPDVVTPRGPASSCPPAVAWPGAARAGHAGS